MSAMLRRVERLEAMLLPALAEGDDFNSRFPTYRGSTYSFTPDEQGRPFCFDRASGAVTKLGEPGETLGAFLRRLQSKGDVVFWFYDQMDLYGERSEDDPI